MPDGMQMVPAQQANMLPQNLGEASRMAEYIAMSGLFGCKTKEQAFSLMLLADAEGLHPAAAARDYHIIQGRPSLRADAMLARFLNAGGSVEWIERTDERVEAKFSHPQGGSVVIEWDMARAEKAGLSTGKNKHTWEKYSRQMLTARTTSEGVRTVYPGVVAGLYTPEEVKDFDNGGGRRQETVVEQEQPAQQKADSMADRIIGELGNHATINALELYCAKETNAIVNMGKEDRTRVQNAIRDRREEISKAADVQDAEFEETAPQEPIQSEASEQTDAGDQSDDEKFVSAFIGKCGKAPDADGLADLWTKYEGRLDTINEAAPELYEQAAEAWQTARDSFRHEQAAE
jgi:hypothetical protein